MCTASICTLALFLSAGRENALLEPAPAHKQHSHRLCAGVCCDCPLHAGHGLLSLFCKLAAFCTSKQESAKKPHQTFHLLLQTLPSKVQWCSGKESIGHEQEKLKSKTSWFQKPRISSHKSTQILGVFARCKHLALRCLGLEAFKYYESIDCFWGLFIKL